MASIKVTERIGAKAEAVWDLFRDFGGVQRYSPQIEGCSVEGEGIGAVRTLTLPGGLELQERLEAFDDAAQCIERRGWRLVERLAQMRQVRERARGKLAGHVACGEQVGHDADDTRRVGDVGHVPRVLEIRRIGNDLL